MSEKPVAIAAGQLSLDDIEHQLQVIHPRLDFSFWGSCLASAGHLDVLDAGVVC